MLVFIYPRKKEKKQQHENSNPVLKTKAQYTFFFSLNFISSSHNEKHQPIELMFIVWNLCGFFSQCNFCLESRSNQTGVASYDIKKTNRLFVYKIHVCLCVEKIVWLYSSFFSASCKSWLCLFCVAYFKWM